jgi:hypothetical protein
VNAPPPGPPPPQTYPLPAHGYGPAPGAGGPLPPQNSPKKRGNGCLVALAIVGGIILLAGLVTAIFVYRFVNSPDGKKVVSAVTSGAALYAEATGAPGTKELAELGCAAPLVIDTGRMQAIAESFGDAGMGDFSKEVRIEVICQAPRVGPAPSCDDVAATYVRAVGGRAGGAFAASVVVPGRDPSCLEKFSADGKKLGWGRAPPAHP